MAMIGDTDKGQCQHCRQHQSAELTCEYLWKTSVFHGVEKIGSAPRRFLKVLWLLSLLGMCGAMTYQLVRLTTTFFSFPVKTTVQLAFSPLVLPEVTICNNNPIRLSHVNKLSCPLQIMLKVDEAYTKQECLNETKIDFHLIEKLCTWYKQDIFCVGDRENLDLFYWRRKETQLMIVMEDREQMQEAGHQVDDMVIKCSFAGVNCFTKNISSSFRRMWTMEYGNCYTLNTSHMKVLDSGPPSGLDILLDVETEELLTSYKTGYGLRVVFHEPGQRPFPSSEGFTISAGFETDFALRMEEVTRLGGRYGNCKEDESDLFDNVDIKYSQKACRMLCLEGAELQECGCTDAVRRTTTPSKHAKVCTEDSEFYCTAQVSRHYMERINTGENCPCGNACRERVFRVRYSARQWPAASYIPVLEETVCRNHHASKDQTAHCRAMKANQTLEQRRSSYVRLRLYFESLNYEKITQEPFYDAEHFLSDIGGALGLWVGASLLGLGEGLELIFLSLLTLWRYLKRQQHASSTASHDITTSICDDCSATTITSSTRISHDKCVSLVGIKNVPA